MDAYLQSKYELHEPSWRAAYPLFSTVIRDHELRRGAEVGVAFGGHSEAILQRTSVERLYSVDMYRHDPAYEDPLNFTQEQFDELFDFVKSRLAAFGDRCELLRLESGQATQAVPDGLDFVYLDANHAYEGVFRDLCLWFRKVRDGGIIGGHDYGHVDFPGVRVAVDEFFRRFGWPIHTEGEGVWWVEKVPLHISVVIPAYNCADTIEETIQSTVDGNLEVGDEIIIVNDASDDGTAEVIERARIGNRSIRVLEHLLNRGTAAAGRNTGIEAAANALVFCLDADNVLQPGSLPTLKQHLLNTGADSAAFGQLRYFAKSIDKVTHEWIFPPTINLADALSGHYWPGPSGNYLLTKESWVRAGRYVEPSLENPTLDSWIFGIRQLGTGSKMVTLADTWYFHRYGHQSHYMRNSMRGSQSLAALIGLIPFLDKLDENDVEYIFSPEGRYQWYERLAEHPLRIRGEATGKSGMVSYKPRPVFERAKIFIRSKLTKAYSMARKAIP